MKFVSIALALATFSLSSMVYGQPAKNVDEGKEAYEAQCSVCHGADAKGHGLFVPSLKVAPTDLTTLSKRNGGVFPADRIAKMIDGREQIAAHGSRDMPIWGKRYAINAAGRYFDVPYDEEAYIRGQVLLLVDYLNRIQEK